MPIYTPEEKATAMARARKHIHDLSIKSDLDDLVVSSLFAEGYLQCLVDEGVLTAAEYDEQKLVLDKDLSKRRDFLMAHTDH